MKLRKILLVIPSYSAFAPYIIKNLQILGYQTQTFDYYSPNFLSKILGIYHNIIARKSNTTKNYLDEYINRTLYKIAVNNKPHLILFVKGKNIYADTLMLLKRRGFLLANWYPDYYDDWQWIRSHAHLYNYFFTPCLYVQKALKNIGINAPYIPFATEPDSKILNFPKKYYATFVGRYTNRRNKYFKKVHQKNLLDVWGYSHWKQSLYKNIYHGEVTQLESKQIIRESKITLNTLTGEDNIPIISVNYRLFEATGVGGFVLSLYHPPLEQFFRIDKEIVIFKSPDEALEKTRFYLAHDNARNKIAYAGWTRTKQNHTYNHRLQKILSFINH